MKTNAPEHEALIAQVADRMPGLLRQSGVFEDASIVAEIQNTRADYDIRIVGKTRLGARVEFLVECKVEPRPVHFPYVNIVREFRPDGKVAHAVVPVLAARAIGKRMAEVCWDQGWGWLDLAGNVRISVPGLLYLEKTGQKSDELRPRPAANLGTPQAGRVLRALLAPENAGQTWTQLSLNTHVGKLPRPIDPTTPPSLGLVNKVVHELLDEKLVEKANDGIRVREPMSLLEAWKSAYRFDRHRRTDCFSLLKGVRLDSALQRLESISGGHAAYAVFSAAERQAPNVRQPKVWLYVAARFQPDFLKLAEAKPVESGANLVVLNPDDDGVFYLQEGAIGQFVSTNPVQTYVDLCHAGGRGEEAAESILNLRLKPAWQRAGWLT